MGRGAQGQPWIVGQIDATLHSKPVASSPVGQELLDIIVSHYNGMRSAYGDDLAIRVARKHLRWYLQTAGVSQDIIRQHNLLTLNDCDAVILALKEIILGHFQASSAA
ncbi:hypothetical protein MNBD_ALPHA11-210 [hydrothermal vent metagenome]|uniref:DUS-like FMN-binding domain-containing protein n=1 Tax=hydrothermal vent metagenome TaxID=652676 RepID=A0A3B0UH81_9ZZZZ